MRKQTGFTLVEVLLIILVITVIGFGGYYVFNQQQSDNQDNTSQQSANNENTEGTESSESNTEEALPAGFVLYENEDLGFEFIHPESWGDVAVRRYEPQHDGAQYSINFSESEVVGAIATAAYKYTGPAMGGGSREIGTPDIDSNTRRYSQQNTVTTGDRYFVGASSLCEYMGQILLRAYIGELDNFALLQFTYPYEVQPGFDCMEEASENSNLLQFFDDELISDFETIATYNQKQ